MENIFHILKLLVEVYKKNRENTNFSSSFCIITDFWYIWLQYNINFLMKTPLAWVSLYTPLDTLIKSQEVKSLAHIYSTHTAEIDGIETHAIPKVVVGKVLWVEKHPDSKKLSIVKVALGEHGEEIILTGHKILQKQHMFLLL